MPDTIPGGAPAKINLVLEVLGRRADSYHELSTVIQKVGLADTIVISWDREPGVSISGPAGEGAPASDENLVWQAAIELHMRAGLDVRLPHIAIEKHIPPASGLGGGASDAATCLRMLSTSWRIEDESLLLEAANAIGSDEAFFLGGPTAHVTGRGDRVSPCVPLPHLGVVIFTPQETLAAKTATLFRSLSTRPFDDGSRTSRFLSAHPRPLAVDDTFNAFERVAFEVFPTLARTRDAVESAIGTRVRLAGAGPSLFWIGEPGAADSIAASAAALPGITTFATTTLA
jgi:4-diphosphocytidyl-2-C-methyl-D-erythritol kinase